MIDKILKAARKLHAGDVVKVEGTGKDCPERLIDVTGRGAKAPLDAASIEGLDAGGIHRRIRLSHFATCPKAPGGRR